MTTLEALESARVELETAMAEIRAQIDAAKARVFTSGDYSDPAWYAKANAALRFKGIEHQRLLREIAVYRRQERTASNGSKTQAFIDAARRRLTPEMFQELWDEANNT